jgi:alkylated DNA repair protein (DNA oxidative demethylase)
MAQQLSLAFDSTRGNEWLAPGALLLRGAALADAAGLLGSIAAVAAAAPFRHMQTTTGRSLAAAMTNCGSWGWVGDRRGYRYERCDPESGQPWPALPASLQRLAGEWAAAAGYADFAPDACLVNRYAVGAGMALHQDRDEEDFDAPIVSVSLGLPVDFLWGGQRRGDRATAVELLHGDVLVFGGPARLRFHGVRKLRRGHHPATGSVRFNLTLRRARRGSAAGGSAVAR